jgi:EmrB/QacA subfamily drug resistance transporter
MLAQSGAEEEIAVQSLGRTSRVRGPERVAAAGARPRWVALSLLASAQLMLVLDVTVVNVALPDIGAALHLQRSELPWVMTIYTLVFGGLMLLGGRIADLFGARRLTLAGLALFTASSLLCALSRDAAMLLAGRSLQGLGAALMSPAALATVMTLFTGPSRGKALGVWSGLAGVGSALGVILGGVLTSEAGWRWVFAINVPIGAALLVAIPLAAPARPPGAVDRSLDLPGAALVTAGTAAAIYGLINAGSHGWAAISTVLPLVLAAAIWALFALVERRTSRPLLAVGLLGQRAVPAGSFLMLAGTGLLVGGFFLGSFALQRAHHYSALHVGLAFLPIAVATVAGAQGGSQVLTRVNSRIVAVTGLALAAAGYAIAARWRPRSRSKGCTPRPSWSTSTTWTRWASCTTAGTSRCSNGRWPGTGPGPAGRTTRASRGSPRCFSRSGSSRSPITCRSPELAPCGCGSGSITSAPPAWSTVSRSCRTTGRWYMPRAAVCISGWIRSRCGPRPSAPNCVRPAASCWRRATRTNARSRDQTALARPAPAGPERFALAVICDW